VAKPDQLHGAHVFIMYGITVHVKCGADDFGVGNWGL
jgi:hypothetical protein